MGLLFSLFSHLARAGRPIQHVKTDDVFPVHFIDHAGLIRESIISYTFRFNDVLDPEKLHDSLVHLLGMEDWKKLGGGLRLHNIGKMEIHVLQKYTAKRPAVRFSRAEVDIQIEEHPLGCRLP